MSDRESITYTGKNGAEVRDWVNEDAGRSPDETWFMTKGMTASTGGQAWRYIQDGLSPDERWPTAIQAAVYDPRTGTWVPLRPGDVVEHQGSGYGKRRDG